MRIDRERLKALCKRQGIPLKDLLRRSGVSSTAYYALARKREILPRSIRSIAAGLGVPPAAILAADPSSEPCESLASGCADSRELTLTADTILRQNPQADPDNVWHTLLLLSEPPVHRLKRALLRGRRLDLQ